MTCKIYLRPEGLKEIFEFQKVTYLSSKGSKIENNVDEMNYFQLDPKTTYTFIGDTTVKIMGQDIFYLEFL